MKTINLEEFPLLVRTSVGISLFMVWDLFGTHVINVWLHPYLPGYRVGGPCIWDLGMALLIGLFLACKSGKCVVGRCRASG